MSSLGKVFAVRGAQLVIVVGLRRKTRVTREFLQ